MSTATLSREAFAEVIRKAAKPATQVSATQLVVNWPGQGYCGFITLPQTGSLTVNLVEPPAGTSVQIYHFGTGVWSDVKVGLHAYAVNVGDYLCWTLPSALSELQMSWMY